MKLVPVNENTISCVFEESISPDINAQAVRLDEAIKDAAVKGIIETVVSYNTLVIYFDDQITTHEAVIEAIKQLDSTSSTQSESSTYIIPVCYEAPYALDLKELADLHGIPEQEVVNMHSGKPYLIYMLGFMPGFPYLGGLDERIAMPRRKEPRKRIEAGSVGIAASQTGMYPLDSPGGWNIIGRTPLTLFDPNRNPEVYYQSGDFIMFKPISSEEFDEIRVQVEAGTYEIERLEEV